jgi:hypothetical protein
LPLAIYRATVRLAIVVFHVDNPGIDRPIPLSGPRFTDEETSD